MQKIRPDMDIGHNIVIPHFIYIQIMLYSVELKAA